MPIGPVSCSSSPRRERRRSLAFRTTRRSRLRSATGGSTARFGAATLFERLTSQNRYAILHRIEAVKQPETRVRKIAEFVAMLARGETIHPQRGPE